MDPPSLLSTCFSLLHILQTDPWTHHGSCPNVCLSGIPLRIAVWLTKSPIQLLPEILSLVGVRSGRGLKMTIQHHPVLQFNDFIHSTLHHHGVELHTVTSHCQNKICRGGTFFVYLFCVSAVRLMTLTLSHKLIFFSWRYNPHWGLYFTAL